MESRVSKRTALDVAAQSSMARLNDHRDDRANRSGASIRRRQSDVFFVFLGVFPMEDSVVPFAALVALDVLGAFCGQMSMCEAQVA